MHLKTTLTASLLLASSQSLRTGTAGSRLSSWAQGAFRLEEVTSQCTPSWRSRSRSWRDVWDSAWPGAMPPTYLICRRAGVWRPQR